MVVWKIEKMDRRGKKESQGREGENKNIKKKKDTERHKDRKMSLPMHEEDTKIERCTYLCMRKTQRQRDVSTYA